MNVPLEKAKISSFDGYTSVDGYLCYPDRIKDLNSIVNSSLELIPRGAGLSYSLGSAGTDVVSVCSLQFNRILDFDFETFEVTVESGVKFGDLLLFLFEKKRWLHPVPGYPDITIGGAVGFNIHGKSQTHGGVFSDWVESLQLWLPNQGPVHVDRKSNSQLFDLTMGGMGLTGFILSVKLRTVPLPGQGVLRRRHNVSSLLEAVEILKKAEPASALFSWHIPTRLNLGMGFVYEDTFVSQLVGKPKFKWAGLCPAPRASYLFDYFKRLIIFLVPYVYFLQEILLPVKRELNLFKAQFPFVGKEIYHRIFGKSGVLEYQALVPSSKTTDFFKDFEKIRNNSDISAAMISLKRFNGQRKYLNFNGEGICFSIDVLNSPKSVAFFVELDRLCISHGCLPNVSKDSRLNLETVKNTYGLGYDDFRQDIQKLKKSSDIRIRSILSERLDL